MTTRQSTRPQRQTLAQMERACANFNASHPVGSTVLFWTGLFEGPGTEGVIQYSAGIMGGHTVVVYIKGKGGVALTHVRDMPVKEEVQ